MKLVECVPNFSEGRDRRILDALSEAISSVPHVQLLDVDPGAATHRTVFTFVGPLDAVEEAAFLAIQKAAALIDMRTHKGAHPRLGATDVCPFVPLGDTSMADCVELARRVGRRVGEQLGLPVYLYEEAASRPERRSLAEIRRGEYEGLARKLEDPAWTPDFGPARFDPRAGATVVGAREFLIAYNVTLNTRDRKLAGRIAQNVRETGRPRRGADGRILKDAAGAALTEPGSSMLPATRATGWYIEEYGRAQVSINLTNFRVTPPHRAFEAVEEEAARLGLRVTGSEVVGLIPLEAVLMAGRHFLVKQGKSPALSEAELIRMAAHSLGLSDVAPFDPDRKIIERRVRAAGRLAALGVSAFADEVASPAPVPGGGSVAALCGALSASLSAMVSCLTYEQQGSQDAHQELGDLGVEAQKIKEALLGAVDEDASAFQKVMEAGRMPRGTPEEQAIRTEAQQRATLGAIDVPLSVMRLSVRAQEIALRMARVGLASAASDAGVAALAAWAAACGAELNVRINLSGLSDEARGAGLREEASRLSSRAERLRQETLESLAKL